MTEWTLLSEVEVEKLAGFEVYLCNKHFSNRFYLFVVHLLLENPYEIIVSR